MKKKIDKAASKRAAVRSTRDSALLEGRAVPAGFVRAEKTERYLMSFDPGYGETPLPFDELDSPLPEARAAFIPTYRL